MKVKFNAPPTIATEHNGLTVRYAAAKRQLPRLRWYLLVLLVCAPLAYLAARLLIGALWDPSPAYVDMPQSTQRAGWSGRLELLAHPGDVVSAGALLARVHALPVGETLAALPGNTLAAVRLEQDSARRRLEQAAALLRLMDQQRERMTQRLAVVKQLISQGAATRAERAQAEAQLAAAQADWLRAQTDALEADSTLRRLALSRPAGVPVPAQPHTEGGQVLASMAGTVVRILAMDRDWVAADTELLALQGQAEPEIRVFIHPADVRRARVGERAVLHFLDGDTLDATVLRVDTETARTPAESVGPLAARTQAIVAVLKPDRPLPLKYRIGNLPLDVRFNRPWF